jgi:3-hydroxy-3-methylglutaryl CoA synthase/uncharacterized OB-fold protein
VAGLIAYGAYIPHHRLRRSEIAAVLGEGGGSGARAVASYDEDATTMAVEAARVALRGTTVAAAVRRLYLATASPPYLDKTNATAVHAALGLDAATLAVDMGGAPRSAVGAMVAASEAPVPALAVLADVRTGLPGGADERDGGDAAAAFVFGPGGEAPVLAEVLAVASRTDEFLDRWRLPGAPASRVWEERFAEHLYRELGSDAFSDALKEAGVTAGEVDHLIVSGLSPRAVRHVAAAGDVNPAAVADDLTRMVGNAGTAQPGVVLADVLDHAEPGAVIALVVLADGATAFILRTTAALAAARSTPSVATQVEAGDDRLRYATFLSWRGLLTREPPRRPEPEAPAAPPAHRSEGYKYAFRGTRCEACGQVHLPAVRVCVRCGALDQMAAQPMADVPATITTLTVDRLAFTPSPPLVAAVVDFDGGGRFRCEVTDVDPAAVAVGDRVEMTFRRLHTANGVHNYFWKARPLRSGGR